MVMPAAPARWTADMLRALPDDGKRYEIIDGELFVTPAPSWDHQGAVARLHLRLASYVESQRSGRVIFAPADVEFADDTVVEPDLFVVPLVEGREPRKWSEVRRLLLAVEVLSPTTARADRVRKRDVYARHQVPEYWIVDLDARLIERWRPTDERPQILTDVLEWRPDPASEPLAIKLPELFAEILGG
jgi:Uma2 family endonuclease